VGAFENNLIASLLLAVLVSVIAMSILGVYLVLRLRQQGETAGEPGTVVEEYSDIRTFTFPRPMSFRRPDCWLAIQSRDVLAVQAALALHDVKPCSWADGMADGDEQKLFVSPPVSGWILVMGSALPNPCDDEDASFRFLQQLSGKLGRVQLFSTGEVFQEHAWVWMETGSVVRAYAWSGRTLWNQGEKTRAEKELGLRCLDYGQSGGTLPARFESGNTDKVHLLAARWSLDPDEIDERFIERARGLVGEPARFF
jgi:hypothetical protein